MSVHWDVWLPIGELIKKYQERIESEILQIEMIIWRFVGSEDVEEWLELNYLHFFSSEKGDSGCSFLNDLGE